MVPFVGVLVMCVCRMSMGCC